MRKLSAVMIAALGVMAMVFVASCTDYDTDDLVGNWYYQSVSVKTQGTDNDTSYTTSEPALFRDMTFFEDRVARVEILSLTQESEPNYVLDSYRWSLSSSGNRITLTANNLIDMQWDVKTLNSSKLVFTYTMHRHSGGTEKATYTYTRQNRSNSRPR